MWRGLLPGPIVLEGGLGPERAAMGEEPSPAPPAGVFAELGKSWSPNTEPGKDRCPCPQRGRAEQRTGLGMGGWRLEDESRVWVGERGKKSIMILMFCHLYLLMITRQSCSGINREELISPDGRGALAGRGGAPGYSKATT